jgi:hypothetical protein
MDKRGTVMRDKIELVALVVMTVVLVGLELHVLFGG